MFDKLHTIYESASILDLLNWNRCLYGSIYGVMTTFLNDFESME